MPTIKAIILAAAICALYGCGRSASSPTEPVRTAAAAQAPQSSAPFNVGTIFPPGEGREMVLNTCGSCHPVVCCARGQRTAERWDAIQKDHADKVTGHKAGDLQAMFSYLKANFNDARPEPQVPAELMQQGCTPY